MFIYTLDIHVHVKHTFGETCYFHGKINTSVITRDGPKAPTKEITRGGKVSVAEMSALSIQCCDCRPGSDEPGRPITALNREG